MFENEYENESWVPGQPYDCPGFFLEIAEVIRNKGQKASNGHNDRRYIHFNLNFQIDIHRLSSDMIWGPRYVISGVFILPQPWTVRGLRNRYSSHVSSFPEHPSTLIIGPANDKFAHKAVSELLFDPSATYA